jgi:hypothetical protein
MLRRNAGATNGESVYLWSLVDANAGVVEVLRW